MSVFDEPKIDCHCHLLDPAGFPYQADTPYRPSGQETGTAAQLRAVFAAYGVTRALLTQPNSGYGYDNSCMLGGIADSGGAWKGIATVPHDSSLATLAALKALGVVGVAFNVPFFGVPHYLAGGALLEKLAALGLFLQVQVQQDQLLGLLPLLTASPVKLLIDHTGRPDMASGLEAPAFQALLALGRARRASIKLSGYLKFSRQTHPFADTWPFVRAIVDAFGLGACMWGSDWPFLRAQIRMDYGPLLTMVADLFPDLADRRTLFWDTPARLFDFGQSE
jgi:predicted TIM-barrel fold metal-dependent hydrolase